MTDLLLIAAGAAFLWTSGAVLYRWVFGAWLRFRAWPIAAGAVLTGRRFPQWERP